MSGQELVRTLVAAAKLLIDVEDKVIDILLSCIEPRAGKPLSRPRAPLLNLKHGARASASQLALSLGYRSCFTLGYWPCFGTVSLQVWVCVYSRSGARERAEVAMFVFTRDRGPGSGLRSLCLCLLEIGGPGAG
jgi:hypothetical protein